MAFRFSQPPPCPPFCKEQSNTYGFQNIFPGSRGSQNEPQPSCIPPPVFNTPPPSINTFHQSSYPVQEQNPSLVYSNIVPPKGDQASSVRGQFSCPPPPLPVTFTQGFSYPPHGDVGNPSRYAEQSTHAAPQSDMRMESNLESTRFGCPPSVGRYPIDVLTAHSSYQTPLGLQSEMHIKSPGQYCSFSYPPGLGQVNLHDKLRYSLPPIVQPDSRTESGEFGCPPTKEVSTGGYNIVQSVYKSPSILLSEIHINTPLRGFSCPADMGSLDRYPDYHKVNQSLLPTVQSETQMKHMEEAWINNWLSGLKLTSQDKNQTSNTYKVFEVRLVLKKCIWLLQELTAASNKLDTEQNTMSPTEWQALLDETALKKEQLNLYISDVSNPVCLEGLKRILVKRRKKRQYQKRRKLEYREEIDKSCTKRQQLHSSIDAWLKDMQGSVERTKREESLKKEADAVLSSVTRRKVEARRQLALLSALKRLRDLRIKMAIGKGESVSADHNFRFDKVNENLQELWEKQLREYNMEEQGLRLMLSEAVDERDQTKALSEKRVLTTWEQLLFGPRDRWVPDFYLAGESNEDSFVHIRQSWDKFLAPTEAPMSSGIPIGWVLPSNPSTAQWESLLSARQPTE